MKRLRFFSYFSYFFSYLLTLAWIRQDQGWLARFAKQSFLFFRSTFFVKIPINLVFIITFPTIKQAHAKFKKNYQLSESISRLIVSIVGDLLNIKAVSSCSSCSALKSRVQRAVLPPVSHFLSGVCVCAALCISKWYNTSLGFFLISFCVILLNVLSWPQHTLSTVTRSLPPSVTCLPGLAHTICPQAVCAICL